MSQNIAILGAGLLGRLLAWRLLQSGHAVTLFEASDFNQPRSAANTAAAMIAPLTEAVVSNKTLYALGMRSLKFWHTWIAELNLQQELEAVNFSCPGTLAIAHHQDQAELQQLKQDLTAMLGDNDNSVWLDKTQLQQKENELEHFHQALYLPEEGFLDNRLLLKNLLDTVKKLGAKCQDNTAVSLQENQIHFADNTVFDKTQFDHIIDCRGVGAKANHSDLRGVRGEVMWVHCPDLQIQHAIRLMHPRYKLYMVPKPKQQYIIGATEIESEDLSPISVHSSLELASALYTIHPALAEARIIETDVNLRPAFIDNEPRIALNKPVISVNGLHRHGFLLAPCMVDDVVQWINEQSTSQFWNYFTRSSETNLQTTITN